MSDAGLPGQHALELLELSSRWGVAPAALLDGLGLTIERLQTPGTRVPLETCTRLVDRARVLTREPALALYMGLQMRLSSHGYLGFAAMTAPTIEQALALAERFSATRTTALRLRVHVEGDTASVVIEDKLADTALREFVVLTLLVGLPLVCSAMTGIPIGELAGGADCVFPEPEYYAEFSRRLAGRLRFSRPSNRLVFPVTLLRTPLASADPVAMELARAQCERDLGALVDTAGLVGRVRAAIGERVSGVPSIEEMASRLHVSTRTLKRRLAEQGTTYSALVDEERKQRALLLLAGRADLSIAEIASRLGYSEVPNFTRAFRRWTGETPAAYRGRG